jgi:hypothetical protein
MERKLRKLHASKNFFLVVSIAVSVKLLMNGHAECLVTTAIILKMIAAANKKHDC